MNRISRQAAAIITLILIWLLTVQPHSALAQVLLQKPKLSDDKLQQNTIIITVRSGKHAAFISDLRINSREMNSALIKAKQMPAAVAAYYPDIDIALLTDNTSHFRLEYSGNLWNETTATRTILPNNISVKLVGLAESLRTHHYGKLISWQQSTQILPNKSIFSVTELESGLTFQVQRRAGSDHADVQPLTKDDTRIMKQIYDGKWSWRRKAVLIHSGDEWIAASMNGMPHGGDGIPENGFSGHFCIHFLGSSTHKSDSPDPAHQMMVHKAAGHVKPYFDSANPLIQAKSFVEVIYHKDMELLLQLTEELPKEKLASFIHLMESLVSIRELAPPKAIGKTPSDDSKLGEALTTEIKLPITIHQLNKPRWNGSYTFLFKRESTGSPWRIQDIAVN